MSKTEDFILEHLSAIRTGNDHAAMRIIQSMMLKGFTTGVIAARNRPDEGLAELQTNYIHDRLGEERPAREYNKDFKGVHFRAIHSRKGTRVNMGVPVMWNNKTNSGERIYQKLGEIRRKNDGRFIAYPRYKVTLFEDYNSKQLEWTDAHPRNLQYVCSSLYEAQTFLLSLLPDSNAEFNVELLTMDDIPKESPWHQEITVAPHIRDKMRA